jgi:hypothetical protein
MRHILTSLKRFLSPAHSPHAETRRLVPGFEELQPRLTPACTASLSAGVLTIQGTDLNDSCVISRNAAGQILLDPDGAGPALAASADGATIFNTHTINVRTFVNKANDMGDLIVLDFTNGLFGTAGKNDVKINVDSGDTSQDNLHIKGTLGDDWFDLGMTNGTPHINLDGDSDVDVVTNGVALEFIVYGQRGNDHISGAGTAVVGTAHTLGLGLIGGGGDDRLIGGEGLFNTFIGGTGNDTMVGGKTIDRYFFAGGFLGSDRIYDKGGKNDGLMFTDTSKYWGDFAGPVAVNLGVASQQTVNPTHLKLTLMNTGVEHVIGSPFNDYIVGNAVGNKVQGGEGNDVLVGLGGNDWLYGDGEWLSGKGGNDRLFGGTGDDYLWGGWGRDYLFGSDGSDHLNGGEPGKPQDGALDHVYGQAGADAFVWALFDVFDKAPNELWVAGP